MAEKTPVSTGYDAATTMRKTWLVQRLRKPRQGFAGLSANVFSFGGGYKNGGLSDDAMAMLAPIFSFDYMGSAEFEFGAVPEALSVIARAADKNRLLAFVVEISLQDVASDWRDKSPAPNGSAPVYALCPEDQATEVERRIRELAAKDYTLKEATHLPGALRPFNEWDGETCGWLELSNGFMFFTDPDMWAATCEIFGVRARVTAPAEDTL